MNRIIEAFTLERRQAIQVFLGSLVPILVLTGYATQTEAEQYLILSGAAIQFVASLLSVINLRGAWTIWLAIRAAIYTAGATVAPALTVLGYVSDAQASQIATAVSLGLSALSSLLAIFVSGAQQTEKVRTDLDASLRAIRVEKVDPAYIDYLDHLAADTDPHREG